MDEQTVTIGSEVKYLGGGKVGGHLVLFGDPDNTDLTGDFFTKDTDFGLEDGKGKTVILYHHGMDETLKRRKLGTATVGIDDVGVWIEGQLAMRDKWEKGVGQLVETLKTGWSSGTAPHLVERKMHDNGAYEITAWPLGLDASITPIPAEPRTSVVPLKAYLERAEPYVKALLPEGDAASAPADAMKEQPEPEQTQPNEVNEMDQDQIKAIVDAAVSQAVEANTKAIMDKLAAEPPSNPMEFDAGGNGNGATKSQPATTRETPEQFSSLGEQLKAIKDFTLSNGMRVDNRLPALKAIAGANESVGSEGGFLLQPTFSGTFLKPMHETGVFSSRITTLPVGPNSNSGMIYGVDETSRATGSRWGGVRGYRVAEGGSFTSSKPAFREINWRLEKYGVLVYATDELLADSTQLEAVVNQSAGEELDFMVNDDILNGTGAGMLSGVLNSAALISVPAESGQPAATIEYNNLTKMWARLHPRSRSKAVWFINQDVNPELDNLALAVGTGAIPANYITYGPDGVMRIKGRPVVETEFNATLGTVGDILLADMSDYLMWQKGGVQSASSIHVQFLTDQTVFRFIYRVDGQPATHSALTPYKGSNTVSPYVALATRS